MARTMMLSEKDRAEILVRYRRGQSARQLAARFGVSPDIVERCIPAGERRRGQFVARELPITEAELVRLREAGATYQELAERTGLTLWGARSRYLTACRRQDAVREA